MKILSRELLRRKIILRPKIILSRLPICFIRIFKELAIKSKRFRPKKLLYLKKSIKYQLSIRFTAPEKVMDNPRASMRLKVAKMLTVLAPFDRWINLTQYRCFLFPHSPEVQWIVHQKPAKMRTNLNWVKQFTVVA